MKFILMVRGLIKDLLVLYVAYKVLKIWWFKEQVTAGVASVTIIVSLLVIWFMLERIGAIPKMD
ncbi:MAG: hypothetical protein Q8O03_00760 [Nanoarchaeota archaeon]|nr:hypothetical protein [Nanoarchaeota archaeon]